MEEFPIENTKRTQLKKKITIQTHTLRLSNENINDDSHLLNSSEYFEENNINPQFDLYFLIQGVKYHQDNTKVLNSCPLISKVLTSSQSQNLTSAPIILELPSDVTLNNLKAFYSSTISPSLVPQSDLGSVLVISEYFENTVLSQNIMLNYIKPSLNHMKAVSYLILSYDKIRTLEIEDNKEIWIQLYDWSKLCIINQLNLMSNDNITRLHKYNSNLFFEILQSYCYSIDCCIQNSNSNNNELLSSIENIFNCNNLLIVIDELYKEKFSPKVIEHLVNSTISKRIEINAEYKEYEMKLDSNEEVIQTSISFNQITCSYNITITPISKEGLFMYSLIYINDIQCLGNALFLTSFGRYTNYAIDRSSSKFKGLMKKNDKFFLHIKPDYTFTTLVDYLINNIKKFIDSFSLINSNIGLMTQLLLSLKSKAVNQNTLLLIVLNWLSNETNSFPENIIALSEHINWRLIKIELIAEFYIKYSFALKKNLINMLAIILKENKLDKIVQHMTSALWPNNICHSVDKKRFNKDNRVNKMQICSTVSSVQLIGVSVEDKSALLVSIAKEKNKARGISNLTTASTQFVHTSRSRKSESMYSVNNKFIQQSKTPSKRNTMSQIINNRLNQNGKKK